MCNLIHAHSRSMHLSLIKLVVAHFKSLAGVKIKNVATARISSLSLYYHSNLPNDRALPLPMELDQKKVR